MDATLVIYIKLLVSFAVKKTASTLCAVCNEVSHDQITRALNKDVDWQTLLDSILKSFRIKGGYLIIDDTTVEKPYGKDFAEAGYMYSSSKSATVFGYQLVLLIWTDGIKRVVIGSRLYRKGQCTKIKLALDLLSHARNSLKIKPDFVLFDSWYAAKQLMKRLKDYGWYFVTRLKKNRTFNGVLLSEFQKTPYWQAKGTIVGGLKVSVVKNGNKYFATNRLSLSRKEILMIYKIRQHIEEVNKQLKFIGLNDCQIRSVKGQENHIMMCIFAFSFVERKSRCLHVSFYKCSKIIMSRREPLENADIRRALKVA